jgi:hypothetical protein
MTSGICKLCLKKKPLQWSHLIPAAVTQTLRGSVLKVSHPTFLYHVYCLILR